jgi:hypothetical protein
MHLPQKGNYTVGKHSMQSMIHSLEVEWLFKTSQPTTQKQQRQHPKQCYGNRLNSCAVISWHYQCQQLQNNATTQSMQ